MEQKFTVAEALDLARSLHQGQVDKGGKPYHLHVEAVGNALKVFGNDAVIAGYLHDAVEDTDITINDLIALGLSTDVTNAITFVSRNLYSQDSTYMDMIRNIATEGNYLSRLVKVADNAHNSRVDRVIEGMSDEHMEFSRNRYAKARKTLYPSLPVEDIETILRNINPDLLVTL